MKDEYDRVTTDFVGGVSAETVKALSGYMLAVKGPKITGRRYKGSKTPDTNRPNWRTPEFVFLYLEKVYGPFDIDLAACENSTKCDLFFSEEDNSLVQDWSQYSTMFLNPPYNNITPWVDKCVETLVANPKAVIVVVLPNDNSPVWYRRAVMGAYEVINLISDGKSSGRLSFIDAGTGKPGTGNGKGTNIFVFKRKRGGATIKTSYIDEPGMMAAIDGGSDE